MTQFPLRIPDHVMDQAREAAVEDKMSINQLMLSLIAEGLGHRRGPRSLRERAGRGDPQKSLDILAKSEGDAIEPGDEMPITVGNSRR